MDLIYPRYDPSSILNRELEVPFKSLKPFEANHILLKLLSFIFNGRN